ncbi:hypothetical protein LCUFL03_70007 [Latilactobacillus curvatus]|nr:hypothetical protein LCUFL03_70007 [Latilactobacillus curvatus]
MIATVYYSFFIRICDLVILIGEHNIIIKKLQTRSRLALPFVLFECYRS